jgi:4-hydroxyphenylpyruvate dioxygenase
MKLERIHHVEFWVGNAKQAAYYYRKAFGFSQRAYRGLETGSRDRASYMLQQGQARFVLTTALSAEGPIGEHVSRHGDGVRDVAFQVDDARAAFAEAVGKGAQPVVEPHELADEHGSVWHAAVATYGDTIHSFYSVVDYDGPFLPGYVEQVIDEPDAGLLGIDHIVGNVHDMNRWAEFYDRVFGMERYITFDDKDISTAHTALMSVVMSDQRRVIKFPINEPAKGLKKSQIEEYLEFYGTAGVQHVALLTDDIRATCRTLRDRGVEFLHVPDSYYDELPRRVGDIAEPLDDLRPLAILVDRDDEGYLLQLFTRPVEDRPTVFFEIIQRRGARGFGKGNFRALFESIEREQARRGTL